VLRADPAGLGIDLSGQLPIQLLQRRQSGLGIGAQRICLDHTHIPAARPLLKRRRPKGQLQKSRGQRGGKHKPPAGLLLMQGGEHGRHTRAMAEAVAAHAGINQHA
jgi:hypothetical protein